MMAGVYAFASEHWLWDALQKSWSEFISQTSQACNFAGVKEKQGHSVLLSLLRNLSGETFFMGHS